MKLLERIKRFFLAKKYEALEEERGKYYGKLFSTLFEVGYFAGYLKDDPVVAWNEVCKMMGIKCPISDKLLTFKKGGSNVSKTS